MPRYRSFQVRSRSRLEFIDITSAARGFLREIQANSGLLLAYTPHTTAAITINENADPAVRNDISAFLQKAIPDQTDFRHAEGNSPAHIMASLFTASQTLIVEDGQLVLGTWQGLFFCEFDGPRERQIFFRFLADPVG